MSQGQVLQTAAFILHRQPYRDTSQIIEIFSREYGRLGLVARGSRRPKSRLRAVLQPFGELLLSWSGRGELKTLTDAESGAPLMSLTGDSLYSAFYMNELLIRLLQRMDPHQELFGHYRQTLASLALGRPVGWSLRMFECALLEDIGYGLNLACEVRSGEVLDPETLYDYRLGEGPVLARSGQEHGLLVHGRALLSLSSTGEIPDEGSQRQLKRVLRAALDQLLGERPLKTRQVLGAMKH
ncbi:MAG: DNA repair protein RecO [Gammaproteobacteria bacterium]|nr:DNA repair protein RecO [Gammaproteobacteria bacterium]